MKETVKIIAVLTVVCLLSSALLSYFSGITFARIEQNGIDAINDAIRVLAPQAVRNEEFSVSGLAVYRLFDAGDNNFGYAFIAQGQGYAGTIKMMVLTDMAISEINGMAVLESVETPGLGAKIKENSFRGQFVGLSVIPQIILLKDKISNKNEVQAITGATISSRSVVRILNDRIEELKENIK